MKKFNFFIKFLKYQNPSELILPATLIFSLTVTFSAFLRLLNLWLNCFVSARIASEISCDAYRKTLYQDYKYHLNSNTEVKQSRQVLHNLLAIYTLVGSAFKSSCIYFYIAEHLFNFIFYKLAGCCHIISNFYISLLFFSKSFYNPRFL